MPKKGHRLYSEEWRFIKKRWGGMMGRCYGANSASYKKRGIDVYAQWHDFPTFYSYICNTIKTPPLNGKRYTLDRIDNDKGYYPDNIRWADYRTQERNRSTTVIIEHAGRKGLLVEFAEEFGIRASLLYDRIFRQKWTVGEALHIPRLNKSEKIKPYRCKGQILFNIDGVDKSISEIAKQHNINKNMLADRLRRGWSLERAIVTESSKGNASLYKAKKWCVNNEYLTMKEICAKYRIKRATLDYRLKSGWTLEDAINVKPDLGNKIHNMGKK